MKISVSLFVLFSAGSLLAQSGSSGGGSGGTGGASTGGAQSQGSGVSAARGAAVQQPTAGVRPALGSPVRSGLPTTSPVISPPAGQTPASQTPVDQTPAGVAPSQAPAGAGTTADLIIAPQGITPANPIVAPPTTAPTGPIDLLPQNLNQNNIIDPSGVTRDQGSLGGTGRAGGTALQTSQSLPLSTGIDAFGQQLQAATSGNGTTQMAFPEQNALVTIASQNGSLTLRGVVSSEQQRQIIEQAVRGVASGTFIDNQIQITPQFDASGTSTIVP